MTVNKQPGKPMLIVFEGPDGVGKTELSKRTQQALLGAGKTSRHFAFPGNTENSLGKLVYELHRDSTSHNVEHITPAALQALHIAAHIDAIENQIRPTITTGSTAILDRYWWSTWVYGTAFGVNQDVLAKMIALENSVWGSLQPDFVFLIDRESPLRNEPENWPKLRNLYANIAARESSKVNVHTIENNSIEKSMDSILNHLL